MGNEEIIELLKHQIHEMSQDIENYLVRLDELDVEIAELKLINESRK